jgi:hypothetical protein
MSFQFPVEPGQVLVFATSVADRDPVYEAQLGSRDGVPLVVPPTFVRSAEHFDPDSLWSSLGVEEVATLSTPSNTSTTSRRCAPVTN